nr:endo alpha-1,4 polygalactosaminidase [Solirubrobacterales bacterium]
TGQYQLEASPERADDSSGRIDVDICRRPASGGECVRPRVIDFDLYLDRRGTDDDSTLNRAGVDALHARGGYAVCYVDAGSAELFRPDFPRFRRWHRSHGRSLLGNPFSRRFPDERWINIGARKQRRFVLGVMEERTAKCARAGFDAVEYDVVEAWSAGRRTTGWNVSYRDQLTYNRSLARLAHEQGLAVGLKNDLGQARALAEDFDFAINEECAGFDECRALRAFTRDGKPVFHVEYELEPDRFCDQTQGRLGFQSIKKARDFSLRPLPYVPCE